MARIRSLLINKLYLVYLKFYSSLIMVTLSIDKKNKKKNKKGYKSFYIEQCIYQIFLSFKRKIKVHQYILI